MAPDQFLKVAAQKMPSEFKTLTVLACNVVQAQTDGNLKYPEKREVVKKARKELSSQYQTLLISAKAQGYGPKEKIGPYQIVNFLV